MARGRTASNVGTGNCFPKQQIIFLAVRPRSIGVAEMADSFVVSFLEAPNPEANAAMESWVKGIAS